MRVAQEQSGQIIHCDIDDGVDMLVFGVRPDNNACRGDVDLRPSLGKAKSNFHPSIYLC